MRKYEVTINQKDYSVLVKKFTPDDAELEINGKLYNVKMDGPIRTIPGSGQFPGNAAPPMQMAAPVASPPPVRQVVQTAQPVTKPSAPSTPAAASSSGNGDAVIAPIPGSILEILVKVGDRVEVGQTVVKMEAMKMENEINAPIAGTVSRVLVEVGNAVNQGQKLVEIEP